MDGKKIAKERVPDFLDTLKKTKKVIAPVDVDGVVLFKLLGEEDKVLLDYSNTVVPPKDWFFSQSHELFTFENTLNDLRMTMPEPDEGQYILFGIRPCDLESIALLDKVFLGDVSGEPYSDDEYRRRREQTTLIGLSCTEPASTCFCTSFELSPVCSDQADILFTELGEEYLVEVMTEKGEDLLQEMASFFEEAKDLDKGGLQERLEEEMIELSIGEAFGKITKLHDSPYWEELALRCIGCGICTYICPTCHCFDLSDESKGGKGRRVRTWDSCMFSNFTLMTSGENPRPTQKERVRQRFFHKLRYFQERYSQSLCVGCGRCIDKCPVNIDISQIIQDVKEMA